MRGRRVVGQPPVKAGASLDVGCRPLQDGAVLTDLLSHWTSLLGVPLELGDTTAAPEAALCLQIPAGTVYLSADVVAAVGALQLMEEPDGALNPDREQAASRVLGGDGAPLQPGVAPADASWRALRVGEVQGQVALVPAARVAPGEAGPAAAPPAREPTRAAVMMVDLSGELRAFITERLKAGTLVATRPTEKLTELDEKAAVLVLGPEPSWFRGLNTARTVVLRRPE